jgi:hypothetical protein
MLAVTDLLQVPFDEQFARAGAQYARDSLHFGRQRPSPDAGERLRRIVTGIAFEMATRRWLEAATIRYDRLGATVLTTAERFDLAIGGRRCDLKCNLISDRGRITALHDDLSWLMEAEALVPDDHLTTERLGENDIYIFGFVTGLEARHSTDTQKALAKGLPVYMVYLPNPDVWAQINPWQSLGGLAFKSNAEEPLRIEIGGHDTNHKAIRERVKLPPRVRITTLRDYYSVVYLGTPVMPAAAVGIHSFGLKQTQIVEPLDWDNIWLYGQRVYLCGWLNKHDFRENSRHLPARSVVKQAYETDSACWATPVCNLRSMAELAEIALAHQHRSP